MYFFLIILNYYSNTHRTYSILINNFRYKYITMDSWIVVNYLEDESVEAVPNFWYHQNKCIWPNKKNILKHCIVKRIPITEFDHTYLKARILCSAGNLNCFINYYC